MRYFKMHAKRLVRSSLMVVLSVGLLVGAFRLVDAGSLTPVGAPAPTMQSLENIYNSLVGNFDSSAVVQDDNGDALQISKCIIDLVNGGPGCP